MTVHEGAPSSLLTLFSDGTFALSEATSTSVAGPLFARFERMRSLLGSSLEEGIGAEPSLALGGEGPFDHVLPASLAMLPVSGDLAPYGWRIGPGEGTRWRANRDAAFARLDAARLAFFEYEGPLSLVRLGPVSCASSVFMASGELALADAGLVRELPTLIAEGIGAEVSVLRERVPGARPRVMLDERGALRAVEGRVRTASGYRFHRAIGRTALTDLFSACVTGAAERGIATEELTLAVDARVGIVRAALDAGVRSVAVDPLSRDLAAVGGAWEALAEAREKGVELRFLTTAGAVEASMRHVLAAWHELGYAPQEARGFAFAVTRRRAADPAREQGASAFVRSCDLDEIMHAAPAFAERVSD
ncbi:Uncharacterised protein [Mycobacteroides abscessus subsp. abscessus]|nr:Uncharacterised protein [Mycobacteroides abscessus subsp. abscessus]